MSISRRKALGLLAGGVPTAALGQAPAAPAPSRVEPVSLGWLDGAPPGVASGVSWGVPWPRGVVGKEQGFQLTTATGRTLPLQTWPLAYWPDGSLKWSGFATVADPTSSGPLQLALGGAGLAGAPAVRVSEGPRALEIDTGRLHCRLPQQGAVLIEAMTMEGVTVARQARLVYTLEDRSGLETNRTLRLGISPA